jgi:hypothetical protein
MSQNLCARLHERGLPGKGMPRLRDKRTKARRHGAIAAALALAGLLAISDSAIAGQDQLKGGSVVMQLQGSRGLKLKRTALTVPITGGAVDPIDGSGTVRVSRSFSAKRGKGKTKVTITALNLAANGGRGSLSAKVGKKRVGAFGILTGGTLARNGWGATISNISASVAAKGAQALNRAFSPKKGNGAKKSAGGRVKAGQPLGTVVSVTTDPLAVEVVPGGTLTLMTDLGGAFASKLPEHCISLTGVTAIPPAMQELVPPGAFTFPVSGGSAAPDFSAGELLTAGGQTLTKDNGLLTPGACSSAQPPVGTKLVSTEIGVDFAGNFFNSTASLPTGTSLRAPLGTIDFSTGSRSLDPNTNELTVTGATVRLSPLAALTLNTFFPTESGNASDDFVDGDEIGTISISGAKLR